MSTLSAPCDPFPLRNLKHSSRRLRNMNIMPVFTFFTWMVVTAGAGVQTAPAGEGTPVVRARLITETTEISGAFVVGLGFTIAPDWYMYWKNPGDAGLPLDVRWRLPAGFRVMPFEYPTPEKIVHDDLVAYGYYGELLVQCTVIPPPEYVARAGDVIRADLEWLVCKESCVLERDTLLLVMKGSGDATARSARAICSAHSAHNCPSPSPPGTRWPARQSSGPKMVNLW